ncbi:hypothetical protein LP416_18100 [Polaromonas sp. P2-4]|nr:hypothetical protein LP416_18100 [Polaromonas sp. P2-4]
MPAMSVVPPAGVGTTSVMGRPAGCAAAWPRKEVAAVVAAAAAPVIRVLLEIRVMFVSMSLLVKGWPSGQF